MERTLDTTVLHAARARLIKDFPAQIVECLNVLNEDQIWWRPNDRANAIGNLVLHLCGSNRHYIGHCIGGLPFERDRAAEFAERRHIPRAELLRRFQEMVDECDRVLGGLDPASLIQTTDRTGKTTTLVQIILHVLGHVATHTGQIVYTTKLLKEGAIEELWMRTRAT